MGGGSYLSSTKASTATNPESITDVAASRLCVEGWCAEGLCGGVGGVGGWWGGRAEGARASERVVPSVIVRMTTSHHQSRDERTCERDACKQADIKRQREATPGFLEARGGQGAAFRPALRPSRSQAMALKNFLI